MRSPPYARPTGAFQRQIPFDKSEIEIAYVYCSKKNADQILRYRQLGLEGTPVVATVIRPDLSAISLAEMVSFYNEAVSNFAVEEQDFKFFAAIVLSNRFEQKTAKFWTREGSTPYTTTS